MKLPRTAIALGTLSAASCLSLLIGIHAFAESPRQQPDAVATASGGETVVAQDADVTPAGCTDSCCGSGNCCGEAVCCPKRVTEEVKKHCWIVKPELICIPGFRFQCNWRSHRSNVPCDDCCTTDNGCRDCAPPKGGRVRCINVLEKHEYTCEECGYEWEVKCVRTRKGCCRGKEDCRCPSCGCKSGCCAGRDVPDSDVNLTSAN